jgi:Uma2 family endonuclease
MDVGTEITLDPEKEYELVIGHPEEKQMGGARHGGIGARLLVRLGGYVEAHKLGAVYGPDTSYQIGPNERIPDVSFVSASRIPFDGEPQGIWPIAPDLAVEIVSPNDLYEKVITKVEDYFGAGVRQVWLISPEHRSVTIYRTPTQLAILTEAEDLSGDDLILGFRCPVADLFRQPSRVGA